MRGAKVTPAERRTYSRVMATLTPRDRRISEPAGPTLRWLAVLMLVAAGILHLAQVEGHFAEGWHVASFFVGVGVAQFAGGVWLLRPRPATWVWVGIVGSAVVITVWVVSRTSGLPFVEGGEAEPLGIADAFASFIEALTIAALILDLLARRRVPAGIRGLGATMVLTMALAWQFVASAGAFNADDARLALDQPQVIDWLVLTLGASVAATVLLSGRLAWPALAGMRRGLLAATGLLAAGGVILTWPPTIGQNLDCAYAPLATVTGIGHNDQPAVVDIPAGETRLVVAFELRACGHDQVELLDAAPLTMTGSANQIVGFWLLPSGAGNTGASLSDAPPHAVRVPPGGGITGGQFLAVEVRGITGATLQLASLRLTYRTVNGVRSFGFATSVATCTGTSCSNGEQP